MNLSPLNLFSKSFAFATITIPSYAKSGPKPSSTTPKQHYPKPSRSSFLIQHDFDITSKPTTPTDNFALQAKATRGSRGGTRNTHAFRAPIQHLTPSTRHDTLTHHQHRTGHPPHYLSLTRLRHPITAAAGAPSTPYPITTPRSVTASKTSSPLSSAKNRLHLPQRASNSPSRQLISRPHFPPPTNGICASTTLAWPKIHYMAVHSLVDGLPTELLRQIPKLSWKGCALGKNPPPPSDRPPALPLSVLTYTATSAFKSPSHPPTTTNVYNRRGKPSYHPHVYTH